MMGSTRVGRRMDVGRLALAVKRPGIDTRCWVSLAVALGDSVVDVDGLGAFVDIQLMPTEEELTARVGPIYAGEGFGLFTRIREDDELAVLIPSGETSEGPVVVARLWSAADKMPQEVIDNPEDFTLVVEDAKNLRFKLTGSAQVRINLGDGKNQVILTEDLIELGAEGATEKAVLDKKLQIELARIKAELDAFKIIFDAHIHPDPNPLPLIPAGPSLPVLAPPAPFPPPASPSATNSKRVTIDK